MFIYFVLDLEELVINEIVMLGEKEVFMVELYSKFFLWLIQMLEIDDENDNFLRIKNGDNKKNNQWCQFLN